MAYVRPPSAWLCVLLCCIAGAAQNTDEQRKAELERVLRLFASPASADRKTAETKLFEIKDLDRTDAALKVLADAPTDPLYFPALLAFARTRHVLRQGDANPAVQKLVAVLRTSNDPAAQIAVLQALGYCQGESKESAPVVEHFMDSGPAPVRIAALQALADIGYTSANTLAHIRAMLSDNNEAVREAAADAFWMLGSAGWGADAVPDLTLLLDSKDLEMAKRAAMALSAIGPAAAPAVGRLRRLLYTDPEHGVRFHAAWALGAIGPAAAPAVPDLIKVLALDNEPGRRVMFIEAFGKIGAGARQAVPTIIESLRDPRNETNTTAARALAGMAKSMEQSNNPVYLPDLRRMREGLVRYRGDAPNRYRQIFDEEGIRPVDLSIGHLEEIQRARKTLWYSAGLLVVLAASVILLAVPSVTRALLILRGRRWSLRTTECQHNLDIVRLGDEIQLTVRSRMASSASTRLKIGRDGDQLPANSTLGLVRQAFRDGEDVLMTVDEMLYHWHWAALLGLGWTAGRKAVVGGQVCAVGDFLPSPPPFGRYLKAGVLVCQGAPDTPAFLPYAEIEATRVAQVFRNWRARVTSETAVTRQQFADALRVCDVIHLVAHATKDELALVDGPFGLKDLPGLETIRCRWLVLSACLAGDISDRSTSLVYKLVRAGVNVLAAVDRIDDILATEFFTGAYRAWLPRRLVGRTLAEAIREGVHSLAPAGGSDQTGDRLAGLNQFVLYGDPSLQLKLITSSEILSSQTQDERVPETSVKI